MTTYKNENLKSEIVEITTGILLGDGNLQKPSGCKYYRVIFAQNSIRNDHIKTKNLINRYKPRIYSYQTKVNKLNKQSYFFETRISSAFNEHAKIFYFNGSSKKKIM